MVILTVGKELHGREVGWHIKGKEPWSFLCSSIRVAFPGGILGIKGEEHIGDTIQLGLILHLIGSGGREGGRGGEARGVSITEVCNGGGGGGGGGGGSAGGGGK